MGRAMLCVVRLITAACRGADMWRQAGRRVGQGARQGVAGDSPVKVWVCAQYAQQSESGVVSLAVLCVVCLVAGCCGLQNGRGVKAGRRALSRTVSGRVRIIIPVKVEDVSERHQQSVLEVSGLA